MDHLPSPPFIQTASVRNFRSLLTSPTSTPLLYRSASLSQITPGGISTLQTLNITTIFDLRSNPEIQKNGASPDIEGIKRVHAPVFADEDYAPETLALRYRNYASEDGVKGFVKAYTDILESGGPAFRTVFKFLGKATEGEKCLVHCTAGKDRTGVLCALVLMLAGCKDEWIAEEYELTERGLREWKEENIARLMQVEALLGNRKGVETMVSARKEVMIAVIKAIGEMYGGAEGYLRGKCGMNGQDVGDLRVKLVGNG